jgi:hypothetical protein
MRHVEGFSEFQGGNTKLKNCCSKLATGLNVYFTKDHSL